MGILKLDENGDLAKGSIISKAWKTTLDIETGESIKMSMQVDLSGMSIDQLVEKTMGSLIITRQAQERKVTLETLKQVNNGVIHYSMMGKAIKDPIKEREEVYNNVETMPKADIIALHARIAKLIQS